MGGVLCAGFERHFWLARFLGAAVFLVGAAVGHVREILVNRNLSPGNAGAILWTDLVIPGVALLLYFTY
ncbi:hypothetical protein C6N75_03020 [Streptomyces solincola]|uniref:DUF4345 domain-containing protein n=1 Tax=Streptomyces solincola TaxID=2100817 RepID=A0A2S9Q210_9ACTN|nr:hypothetical protein C6N75_03020 [Streptomyces solincola]